MSFHNCTAVVISYTVSIYFKLTFLLSHHVKCYHIRCHCAKKQLKNDLANLGFSLL